jgi:tetratricopeptide (TPR) repeat protein
MYRLMAGIDKNNWEAVSTLLDELLGATAAEREARLDQLRATDPALAQHVSSLLAEEAAVEAERFLEGAPPVNTSDLGTLAGHSIGGYTLDRPLGHGGMANVWLARRSDGRYEGQVAIKFLNLALLGRGGAERLRKEANALAKLAHPNITHLIDAGVAASGQPYLVLEYVEGEPIDRWCDSRALDVQARVRLFLQVLAAVSHAHGRLILHRDLKPSNILVTADGQAKLLDFGIAKLLEADGQSAPKTELTALGGVALTPDYAAPEQAQGADVTTATDQYSLGVLLYVLLAGSHPTANVDSTPVERLQALVDREPLPLSEMGDLDNIVAKTLKKSPAERYATVEAFADDLRRYLNSEPVSARADSRFYRAGKFVRKYRLAVATASIAVLALIAGIVGTTWQAIEARAQRSEAFKQRDRANDLLGRHEAVIEFVDMMLTEELSSGEALAIQRMLERGEALIDSGFANSPAQQADLLRVLGTYYTILAAPQKQIEVTGRGMQLAQRAGDTAVQAELACLHAEGLAYVGRRDEGLRMLDEWVSRPDLEPRAAAGCLQARGALAAEVRDAEGALRFVQEGLERLRGADGPNDKLEASLLGDLAFAYHLAGRNLDADRQYKQVVERLRAMRREESYDMRRVLIDWAVVRYAMGDYRSGLEMLDQSVRIARRVQGDVPVPPGILANRARGLDQLGRYEDALLAYQEAYAAAERANHPPVLAYALSGRANAFLALGRLEDAQASLARAASIVRTLPEQHPAHTRYTFTKARVDTAAGKLAPAHKDLTHLIDLLSAGAPGQALAESYRARAEIDLQRGDLKSATADAQRSLDIALQLRGDAEFSPHAGHALVLLGQILQRDGQHDRARQSLQQAQDHFSNTFGPEHQATLQARALREAN